MSESTETRRFLVTGRVQGVFYRKTAQESAFALGVRGWVRNEPDGSVLAMACGTPSELEAFERKLWQGPPAAQVDQIAVTIMDTVQALPAGFEVR